MKTIILNASPRKNWNTAQMLKEAQKGAASVGAETEYIDLYDLNFTGCRSCLACKRKDVERNKCYWNDDLSPVIAKILEADAVIIGTPIYFGEPTAHFRALLERLAFCMLSYDGGERSYFKRSVNAGFLYTMNAPKEYFENLKQQALAGPERVLGGFLNGKVMTAAACSTTQVDDYGKYAMGMFNPEERKDKRENQFPEDLKAAFDLGAELSR